MATPTRSPRDFLWPLKEVHLDARGQSIFRLATRRNCIYRFAALHRIRQRKNVNICVHFNLVRFYYLYIAFVSSYNMYLPPQRLLEVGKKLVDNNDLVNAVSWFKRAESILFITKGEAARKHLIMVRIQLIQVLEKVRNLIFLVNESWCISFKFHVQLKRFNEALGFCHDVLHNNPEEEFELEVLQLGGRIHFRLWNFSEAKKYVGDAYEMVCRGRGYDGIVKHSKMIFKNAMVARLNQFAFIFRTLDYLVYYKRVRTANSLPLRFLRNSSSRSPGS